MSRTDDIINVAGHRLSTGGMEEVLAAHPDVAECAVLGIKDELKGEVPCGFIVLKAGVNRPPAEIEKEIVALVREKIGPVAAFKLAITVARLPKTRSGKILRGTIKKIADGEPWTMPATIDDPAILDEIGDCDEGARGGGLVRSLRTIPEAKISPRQPVSLILLMFFRVFDWYRFAVGISSVFLFVGDALHDKEKPRDEAPNKKRPASPNRKTGV